MEDSARGFQTPLGVAACVGFVVLVAPWLAGCDDCGSKRGEVEDAAGSVPSGPANALAIPTASVAQVVNRDGLPPYRGDTGSIEGRVQVKGAKPKRTPLEFHKCPAAKLLYEKNIRIKPTGEPDTATLADALVVVTGYEGAYIPEREAAKKFEFADCTLGTRAISMTFGQRLEFSNADTRPYAPTLAEARTPALRVAPPAGRGEPVFVYPPRPGHFTLFDALNNSPMRVDVYVLVQPLHAISDADGHFRIDGIPVGKLELHARSGPLQLQTSQSVVVTKNQITNVVVELDVGADAGAPDDDAGRRKLR